MDNKTLAICILIALATVLYLNLRPRPAPVAFAQPVTGSAQAEAEVAPKQVVWSNTISCDDTDTEFFPFDGVAATADDYIPVPDRSIVLITNETASTVARCAFMADETEDIGSQAALATANDVNGSNAGLDVILGGATDPIKFDFSSWPSTYNGRAAGVCSDASSHDRSDQWDVHKMCSVDADCQSIAGHGAGATCVTTNLYNTLGNNGLRGALLGCRCSAAAQLTARIIR